MNFHLFFKYFLCNSIFKVKGVLIHWIEIYGPYWNRNRETTLMELIQLCRNDGDSGYEDYGVRDTVFLNVPGKRFGSLMQQQTRTNTFLKTVL